jgi:hypothetical protein
MSWGEEAIRLIEKNTKYVTPENAKQLSLYFMMAIDSGHTDYLAKFYKELTSAAKLPQYVVDKLVEDSDNGKKGTEALIMEKICHNTRNKAVELLIDTVLAYGMELDGEEGRRLASTSSSR